MAKGGTSGDWLLAQVLFERGEPSFVDELRKVDDAETLGRFAAQWIADPRPEARTLLFAYLNRPLNAFRHEALVKRLFKLAEAAGDDALMARFLVLFDRSVRRVQGRRWHSESVVVKTMQEGNALAASWLAHGYTSANCWQNHKREVYVWGRWSEPIIRTPAGTTMPRGASRPTFDPNSWNPKTRQYSTFSVPDWVFRLGLNPLSYRTDARFPDSRRKDLERWRLFSIATRQYLRRRAWRYFRKLGRQHPERYVAAVKQALVLYREEDAWDGLSLIDNWGLVHILFHFCPALVPDDRGWKIASGHSLAELEPTPMYAKLWEQAPRVFVDLLIEAPSRPVRAWANRMIRRHLASVLPVFPLEERLSLLGHNDADVVALAAELIRNDPGLKDLTPERWLSLIETANATALEIVCELAERWVAPERVTMVQAVRLAMSRPLPVARLALQWLQSRTPQTEGECLDLLGLAEAESEPLRPEIARWARSALSAWAGFQAVWVLEWLDSRHKDVRAEGWEWFRAEPRARDDVTIWLRLMESPYDDVRLALITELETRTKGSPTPRLERGDLDPELLRLLWASVLLNVYRGNRTKPLVVRQLLRRMESQPADLPRLLPLLAVALRSVRGPELRAGLVAVVQLADRDANAVEIIRSSFPELQLA